MLFISVKYNENISKKEIVEYLSKVRELGITQFQFNHIYVLKDVPLQPEGVQIPIFLSCWFKNDDIEILPIVFSDYAINMGYVKKKVASLIERGIGYFNPKFNIFVRDPFSLEHLIKQMVRDSNYQGLFSFHVGGFKTKEFHVKAIFKPTKIRQFAHRSFFFVPIHVSDIWFRTLNEDFEKVIGSLWQIFTVLAELGSYRFMEILLGNLHKDVTSKIEYQVTSDTLSLLQELLSRSKMFGDSPIHSESINLFSKINAMNDVNIKINKFLRVKKGDFIFLDRFVFKGKFAIEPFVEILQLLGLYEQATTVLSEHLLSVT